MNKLFLIFHGRFPGEKAASVFTAKSAEAFSDVGLAVTVLVPRRLKRSYDTPARYFGVKENFRTVYLPIIDLFSTPFLKRIAFQISYLLFSISTFVYLLFAAKRSDYMYSNEALPLLFLSFFFPHTFYEVHDFPRRGFLNRLLLFRVKGIVVTNRWKCDELVRQFSLADTKLLYEPNAVDVEKFARASGTILRKKFATATGTVLIGYAGALTTMGMEKGLQTLLEAIASLPPRFRLLVVGGSHVDVTVYRGIAKKLDVSDRVSFVGWVRHNEVPEYLAACDVLVAPFPNTPHYNLFMSPMKLFEYMAVGKPIVASRLRTILEVVNDQTAFLVHPSDVKSLAEGITAAVSDPSARIRGDRARAFVQEHSWQKRSARIVEFLSRLAGLS